MKPELIFITESDGFIRISKEDLERLFDKAYEAGKADGSYITTSPWTITPTFKGGPSD